MDSRWTTLIAELERLGVTSQDIEACRIEANERDGDPVVAFIDQIGTRKLVGKTELEDLRMAVRCADEAAGLFLRAHLDRKPVVLLLKGLEEVLKGQTHRNGVHRAQSKTVRSTEPEESPDELEANPGPRLIEDSNDDDDPREQTRPVSAVQPPEETEPRRVPYSHPETAPYEIVTRLGHGRLTQSIKGRDKATGNEVVLKFFPESCSRDRDFTEELFRQARTTISLKHPNLAGISQITLSDKQCYAVMEYVEGESLKSVLASGNPLSPRKVLPIFLQLLRGVKAAHDFGICHGSIHPGNIVIGSDEHVTLMDVGLGELDFDSPDVPEGPRLFQALYRAPERTAGSQPTVASDIYELGATMYHLLAWEPPFSGGDVESLAAAHQHDELPALPDSVYQLSDRLEMTVRRMMEKSPSSRVQEIGEVLALVEEIEAALPVSNNGESARSTPRSKVPRSLSRKRRRKEGFDKFLPHIVVGATALLLMGLYGYLRFDPLANEPKLQQYRDNLIVKDKVDDDLADKLAREGDRGLGVIEFLIRVPEKQLPAVRALGKINTPASRELLAQQLEHENIAMRCETLVVMGKSKHADMLAHLKKSLEDTNPEVRRSAIIGLKEFGDPSAIALLEAHTRDDDISVQQQAKDALRKLKEE